MSKNRPINRSPFRRKPWGKKRPTRWNASTNGVDENGVALNTVVYPGSTPTGPIAIICDGQVDVEPWADEQEVTIDRIVGSILIYGYSIGLGDGSPMTAKDAILKVGIVLNEELTDESPAPVVEKQLFDQESYEDTEWMWLHTAVLPSTNLVWHTDTTTWYRTYQYTIPVDIRNRRKIGQRDELAVYAQFLSSGSGYTISLQSYTDLRCILMSR